jgi:diketogulonate reductase-like aldo/keto reductase
MNSPKIPNPVFIYGTAWKEDRTESCVLNALQAGFRAVDTANQRKHYFEEGVGNALAAAYQAGLVRREELFLQTKFTFRRGQDHRLPYDPAAPVEEQVRQSCECSLQHLRTDYLDSYLLHGPSGPEALSADDFSAWTGMEQLVRNGKTRTIGVSNVSLEQLEELWAKATIKPAFVQNRCYACRAWDQDIRDFCQDKGMAYQGFSLLTANVQEFRHPAFQRRLQELRIPLVQAVFRFAQQVGMIPLTGTTDPGHMRLDLESAALKLSPDDLELIGSLGR